MDCSALQGRYGEPVNRTMLRVNDIAAPDERHGAQDPVPETFEPPGGAEGSRSMDRIQAISA
jgi:hypothetical protein